MIPTEALGLEIMVRTGLRNASNVLAAPFRSFGLGETRVTKRVSPLERPRHLLWIRVGDF